MFLESGQNIRNYLQEKNVEVKDLTFNYYNFLPKNGFLTVVVLLYALYH